MSSKTLTLTLCGLLLAALPAAAVNPPDYKLWGDLLSKYYDPAKGMDYKGLKANDKKTLDELRRQMAQVDVVTLPKNDQLAYWINLYNISVVNVVVEHYPVKSIRDISTDFIAHLNVFKKDSVLTRKGPMALQTVEDEKIRNHFMDPRIHFAINCAAKSCPPIRTEPYVGSKVQEQLDDQARTFLNGPHGVRLEKSGGGARLAYHQDHGLVQGRLREVGRRPGAFHLHVRVPGQAQADRGGRQPGRPQVR